MSNAPPETLVPEFADLVVLHTVLLDATKGNPIIHSIPKELSDKFLIKTAFQQGAIPNKDVAEEFILTNLKAQIEVKINEIVKQHGEHLQEAITQEVLGTSLDKLAASASEFMNANLKSGGGGSPRGEDTNVD
jgi:hypothetical protein